MGPCPTVPFLLESCVGRPFDPTVLAPSRMSELQPHLPNPLHPPCACIFLRFENCGGSGQRGVASACLETGRASGNSDAGVSSCRCPFRGLCWTTGSGQSRGLTPRTDGRKKPFIIPEGSGCRRVYREEGNKLFHPLRAASGPLAIRSFSWGSCK